MPDRALHELPEGLVIGDYEYGYFVARKRKHASTGQFTDYTCHKNPAYCVVNAIERLTRGSRPDGLAGWLKAWLVAVRRIAESGLAGEIPAAMDIIERDIQEAMKPLGQIKA